MNLTADNRNLPHIIIKIRSNSVNERYRKVPHLLYPSILDESKPQERQLGIDMELAKLKHCDELWCYGDRSSHGRVLEQENGFDIGGVKINRQAEAPTMQMAIGMV